jgi:hypothetical protein
MNNRKKLEAIKQLLDTINDAQTRLQTFAGSSITPSVDLALQCYITGEPVSANEMFVHDVVERALQDIKNVHTEHCCLTHGCKYCDADCPVETGKQEQSFPCESCLNVERSEL